MPSFYDLFTQTLYHSTSLTINNNIIHLSSLSNEEDIVVNEKRTITEEGID